MVDQYYKFNKHNNKDDRGYYQEDADSKGDAADAESADDVTDHDHEESAGDL